METASTYPNFPKIDDVKLKNELLPEIFQWALANGLVMYPPKFKGYETAVAPITLFPTPIPEGSFVNAMSVQTIYNELYAHIARNEGQWLSNETQKLAEHDPEFTGKLFDLYVKAENIGITQKLNLGVFRSDYLVNALDNDIKQVEFNTVSVSFGGLSTKVGKFHEYMNMSGKYTNDGSPFYGDQIRVSDSATRLAAGLSEAVYHYRSKFNSHCQMPIVAFIVQDQERNVFDQRVLEYNLLENHHIRSVRMTIHEVQEKTHVDAKSKKLYYRATGEEIALVYFRAGYAPGDFKTEQDWENRLTLELSFAVKAPSILTQLAGTKKIQQMLTQKTVLQKFLGEEKLVECLFPTFVKIYPLDESPLGIIGKKLAFEEPEKYVLKPQREGGGNNIYKEDIPPFLHAIDEKDWSAYVLMELIIPRPTEQNVIIKGEETFRVPIISELGVFGTILFDDTKIYSNKSAGWLLRSKFSASNEGGVAAGFGCIDSAILY